MAFYTAGRIVNVATRPLCLFISNNCLPPEAAQGVAVAFLANALALAVTAASPHRRFYSRFFDVDRQVNGVAFYVYAASVALLTLLGCVVVFAVGRYFVSSMALAIAATIYFVSEKLADELLRLQLFERDFEKWGQFSAARSAIQLVSIGAVIGLLSDATSPSLLVVALTMANLMVFVPRLPVGLFRVLWVRGFGTATWLGRRAACSLRVNWHLWALALAMGGVSYVDRFVALIFDKAMLPLFMLVVMCFSAVQLVVDFYYVSRHRRDFLHHSIGIGHALTSRAFLSSLSAGVVIGAVACFTVLQLSQGGRNFPLAWILAIASVQTALATAAIPREILYWKEYIGRMLVIELLFWTMFVGLGVMCWWLRMSMGEILALLATCVFGRFLLYFALSLRARRTE